MSSCAEKEETELQKRCRAIRSEPQSEFPEEHDKKWQLIDGVSKINDDDWPDSLKSIFGHIDTTIKGYSKYHYTILTQLVVPDSRKGLKTAAEIFREYNITDPSCSQVLTKLFSDQRLWGEMLANHVNKQGQVDYATVLKNLDVMFPDLAGILGKRPFSDGPVLSLLNMGIGSGVLDKSKLETSREHLINYYHLLKKIGSGGSQPFGPAYNYTNYSATHMPNLVSVLKIFEEDPAVSGILKELSGVRRDSISASKDSL